MSFHVLFAVLIVNFILLLIFFFWKLLIQIILTRLSHVIPIFFFLISE